MMKFTLPYRFTKHIVAFSVCAVSFIVYLQTLAPTVSFIDSGELAAVASTLGIAHPTGYPLFTVLGRFFSILPVASEEVVRLNIMAALFTSLSVLAFFYGVHFLISRHTKKSPSLNLVASVFAGLGLGFSQTFWSQSVSVEVYSLHLLLTAGTILFFVRAMYGTEEDGESGKKYWFLFAFALGLSFTNHLTTILLAPAFVYLYFTTFDWKSDSWKRIGILAFPFMVGLSVYLYLPIRGSGDPIFRWGDPTSLERLVWHVTAKQFRVWMFSSSTVAAKQFKYFLAQVPKEFFYVPLIFSLLGAWRLFLRDRRLCIFILLLLVGCVAYSINYDIHDIDSYFLLAFMALMMFAAFGVIEIGALFRTTTALIIFAVVLTLVLGAEAKENWREVDGSSNYLVEDYTKNVLTNLEPHAIVISYQWDFFVSPSYYFQFVKNFRPDVFIVDKELLRRSWYFLQLKRNYPKLIERSKAEIGIFLGELYKFEHDLVYDSNVIEMRFVQMIDSFIEHNLDDTPVYIGPVLEPSIASRYLKIPEGFLFRLKRANDTLYHPAKLPHITYRRFDRQDIYTEELRNLYSRSLLLRGSYELSYGHRDLALPYFRKAYEIAPNSATLRFLETYSSPDGVPCAGSGN